MKRSEGLIPKDALSWALVGVLAGLHIILSFIPVFPIITPFGAGQIPASAITVPLFGIILGPVLGPIAALIGGILGGLLFPGPTTYLFLGLGFIPGVVGAFIAGLLMKKSLYPYSAYLATIIYAVLVLGFLFFPPNTPRDSFLMFLWLHLALVVVLAVTVLVIPIRKRILESEISWIWVSFISFCSTMSDQITGSFFFQAVIAPIAFGGYIPAEIWVIVAFIYPIERLIITIVSTLVGVAVLQAIREIGFVVDQ